LAPWRQGSGLVYPGRTEDRRSSPSTSRVTEEVPQGQPAQVTMRPPHGRARPAPAGDPGEGAAAVRTRPRHLRVEAFSLPGTPSPGGERPLEGGPWRTPKRWTP